MTDGADRPELISITADRGVVTAAICVPRVGTAEAAELAHRVRVALEELSERLRFLVLDLSRVELLTSVGIDLCVNIRNRAHILGADDVLVIGLKDRKSVV